MLAELKVKNFALIKNLTVHFENGLNVITGETGAGKSLVLKSLHLLMGGKAPSDLVGSFSDETIVEGLFDTTNRSDLDSKLKELSYFEEESAFLVVRRVISKKGKSKTYINGSPAAVSDLKALVSPLVELSAHHEPLIELTSQHDNKNLQNTAYQRNLYDIFCKNKDIRFEVSSLFSLLKEKQKELYILNQSESDRLQKLDFLNFQLAELERFQPEKDEYEKLKVEQANVSKKQKLKTFVHECEDSLNNSDQSVLSQLYSLLNQIESIDLSLEPKLSLIKEALEKSSLGIEESVAIVRELKWSISEDESSPDSIAERLKTYEHLFRKYNVNSEGLSEIYLSLKSQRDDLESLDERRLDIENEIKEININLKPLLQALTKSRQGSLKKFCEKVNKSISEMNMKDLLFSVKLESLEEPNEHGSESVSFWLKHNKSGQERPIKKTASGGELSRMLLAIKGALENQEAPRTYLFDEIDAGVSGPTAEKVGKKLKSLSNGQQVITITHLPQVAALGDHHYLIEKTSGRVGHQTSLKALMGDERIAEIARLISGEDITKSSLDHAAQLVGL